MIDLSSSLSLEARAALEQEPEFWCHVIMKLALYGDIRFVPYPKDEHRSRYTYIVPPRGSDGKHAYERCVDAHLFRPPQVDDSPRLSRRGRPLARSFSGACSWAENIRGAQQRGWKGWFGDTEVAVFHYAARRLGLAEFCGIFLVGWCVSDRGFSPIDLQRGPRSDEFNSWRALFDQVLPFEHDCKIPKGKPDVTVWLEHDGNFKVVVGEHAGAFVVIAYSTS